MNIGRIFKLLDEKSKCLLVDLDRPDGSIVLATISQCPGGQPMRLNVAAMNGGYLVSSVTPHRIAAIAHSRCVHRVKQNVALSSRLYPVYWHPGHALDYRCNENK